MKDMFFQTVGFLSMVVGIPTSFVYLYLSAVKQSEYHFAMGITIGFWSALAFYWSIRYFENEEKKAIFLREAKKFLAELEREKAGVE